MSNFYSRIILLVILFNISTQEIFAQSPEQRGPTMSAEVMKAFNEQEKPEGEEIIISDLRKRQIMFAMGIPLLIFIFITGGLGIAMGVYGKDLFLPHLIFAGLSMTLALAHAVVGIVWFNPF